MQKRKTREQTTKTITTHQEYNNKHNKAIENKENTQKQKEPHQTTEKNTNKNKM